MRLLFAAALSLAATTVSAQSVAPAPARVQTPVMRAIHIGPPPAMYSPQQRALSIQRLLHLPSAPTLTQTITLEPRRPFFAGQAELDMIGGDVVSGPMSAPPGTPSGSYAIPSGLDRIYIPNGMIVIKINASPGKRYAFDCSAYLWSSAGGTPSITYTTFPGHGGGTVSEGSDQHFLFVMDSLPSGGHASVAMTLNTTQSAEMVFYGCQISPF